MSFVEYMVKISKYLKKHYGIKMDFEDAGTKKICETGYKLGSFPYYCAGQIVDADDIQLTGIHGCGGIESTADNLLCHECYINGVCGCCDDYVGTDDLIYLDGEYSFDDDYMYKAAREMSDDGYSDVCIGCIEEKARQIEVEDKEDLLWASFATGKPDLFSDEMRWFFTG